MAPVPTMRVFYMGVNDPEPVVINTSDFDPSRHIPLPPEDAAEASAPARQVTLPEDEEGGLEAPATEPANLGAAAVKGIGPATAAALKAAGVVTVGDLAGLSDADVSALDLEERHRDRIREDWRPKAQAIIENAEAGE